MLVPLAVAAAVVAAVTGMAVVRVCTGEPGGGEGVGQGISPEVLNDDKPPASVLGPAVGVFQIPQHALKEGTRAGSEDVLAFYQVRLAQHCQNLLRLRGSIRPVLVLASQMPPGYECRMHDSRPIYQILAISMQSTCADLA